MSGRFVRLAPDRPHECEFPSFARGRGLRTGDEWQCDTCARVWRYRDGGMWRAGGWRLIGDPGYQLPTTAVSSSTPAPPPPVSRPNPTQVTS